MNQVTGRASVSTAVLLTAACLALAACGGGGSSTAAASPQAITFNAPGNQTLGTAPVALSASSDSALVVTLASTTPTVCTVSGTTLTLLAAGLCTVQASQAGNANYAAASDVTVSFTVYQPQTIAFAVGNQSLGSAPVALVATASSGLPVSFSTQTATVCSVSNTTLTLLSAGTCTLLADQPGNSVTAPAPTVTVSFNVAACVIAAPTAADIVSFNNPALTYTVAGFNGDAGAVVADPAGGCRKVGSVTRSAGSQYDGATFGTLAPASSPTIPAIGFTAVSNTMTMRVYVGAAPTLVHLKIENAANGAINYETEVNATQANTWQTLTFTLNAPLVNGLPGQAFNLANTYNRVSVFFGFGSVQGAVAGTDYFDDLQVAVGSPVPQAQTIAFTSPGNQALSGATPTLAATASSGLPVSIASQTPAVCTVNGNALTLVGLGTCILVANQAGDANFLAAPQQSVSFTVANTVTSTTVDLVSFNDPTLTYTVAGFNGDTGAVVADPAGGSRNAGSITRTPGSQYDGATFGTLAPAGSPTIPAIGFTATTNTLTLRVYVGAAPTLVHLKIENAANGAINYETEVNATQANTWQTLTFTLNAPLVNGLPGQAFNLVNTYNRVSLFFGFGSVQGPSAATSYFEDLSLVP